MEVFLFPLVNVTLFPRTTKPLQIFEERYIAMVNDSIEKQVPIALGFMDNSQVLSPVKVGDKIDYVKEVAGYGFPQIIEERINGTLLIFLRGDGRLRLGPVTDDTKPYLVCEAEILEDDFVIDQKMNIKLRVLHDILLRWVQNHIPDPAQKDIFIQSLISPREIIGAFSAYLIKDYDLQQLCLEYNSYNEKIDFLARLIESGDSIQY